MRFIDKSQVLTAPQAEVLAFLKLHFRQHGYPPTVREIARKLGVSSTNAVRGHLDQLERKGRIVRDFNRARGLQVILSPVTGRLPFYGEVR